MKEIKIIKEKSEDKRAIDWAKEMLAHKQQRLKVENRDPISYYQNQLLGKQSEIVVYQWLSGLVRYPRFPLFADNKPDLLFSHSEDGIEVKCCSIKTQTEWKSGPSWNIQNKWLEKVLNGETFNLCLCKELSDNKIEITWMIKKEEITEVFKKCLGNPQTKDGLEIKENKHGLHLYESKLIEMYNKR